MAYFDSAEKLINTAKESISSIASNLTGFSGFASLGSDWTGLNPNLIAHFFVLKKVDGGGWITNPTEFPVHAPILDGAEIEYTLNWQSPFENTGIENKSPAITNMVQAGVAVDALKSQGIDSSSTGVTKQMYDLFTYGEGRSGITKLNSIQTFQGMPPVKCNLKLLFRARSNENIEVMAPIIQLLKWAMPQELGKDSALVNIINNVKSDKSLGQAVTDSMLPSIAPKIIGMQYKGRVYKPLVIESITDPITSPTTSSGGYARAEVTLSIASLTALDRKDIEQIYGFL